MNEPEAHPLFLPREEDDEPKEVVKIHVTRHEGGRQVWCPRLFEASELQSLEDIFEMFGGGHYELIARDSRSKMSDRRRYELPGKSRPLTGEPEPAAPHLGAVPQQAASSGGGGALVPLLLSLAPLVLEYLKSSAAATQAQQAQQSQFLLAMMNRDSENARAHIQTMQQLADRQATSQTEIFKSLLERQANTDPAEVLMRGVELAAGLQAGAAEAAGGGGDSISEIVNGIGAAVDTMQKAKGLVGDDDGQPPGVPPQQQRPRAIPPPAQQQRPAQAPPAAAPSAPPKAANQ